MGRPFAAVLSLMLAGCGLVGVAPSSSLSVQQAEILIDRYYDTCHDVGDVGQCTGMQATANACAFATAPSCLQVSPGFRSWVQVVRRQTKASGSLAEPDHYEAVLTKSGARHCIFGGELMVGQVVYGSAGNPASECLWPYAPAHVSVRRLYQHDNLARAVITLRLTPNPELASAMQSHFDGMTLQTLNSAEGRSATIHLTYDGSKWIVGDPHPTFHFLLFFVIVLFVLFAVGALARIGGGASANESIPAGPAPSMGFAGDARAEE